MNAPGRCQFVNVPIHSFTLCWAPDNIIAGWPTLRCYRLTMRVLKPLSWITSVYSRRIFFDVSVFRWKINVFLFACELIVFHLFQLAMMKGCREQLLGGMDNDKELSSLIWSIRLMVRSKRAKLSTLSSICLPCYLNEFAFVNQTIRPTIERANKRLDGWLSSIRSSARKPHNDCRLLLFKRTVFVLGPHKQRVSFYGRPAWFLHTIDLSAYLHFIPT